MLLKVAPSSILRKGKCKKEPHSGSLVTETDQLSNSKSDPSFICEICIEPRTNSDLFHIKGCSHAYCNDCVTKYVTSKLGDNMTGIGCPVSGCGGILEPEYCRSILPPEVFDRWGNASCEALILEGERFYCPFRDCSALLINDRGAVARESECPNCRRLFCAQCRVPWHAGVECREFQGLKEGERGTEDIMLMKLAEKQHWRRCPKCKFYVQKISGCAFVRCRLVCFWLFLIFP
ncbi:E3 ubiquitin-protein ligase RSL1-like [Syzygium oleosum]|uniref:E3 ubiquitin-protein ligase RSL1-like n=1 Tax=Syzygium oleosum TaxID=219896 RepID=UPI0024BA9AF5|nr:E3 ubiquitin-protein ligase RSL1-like [Syzygium oleosum]